MQSYEDVKAWVEQHNEDGTGIDQLRKSLSIGIFNARSAGVIRAWLDEQDNGARRLLEAEQLDLARRTTAANETSATASLESAKHAAESAKWAKFATVIAVFALLVSAWPYIKDVGR